MTRPILPTFLSLCCLALVVGSATVPALAQDAAEPMPSPPDVDDPPEVEPEAEPEAEPAPATESATEPELESPTEPATPGAVTGPTPTLVGPKDEGTPPPGRDWIAEATALVTTPAPATWITLGLGFHLGTATLELDSQSINGVEQDLGGRDGAETDFDMQVLGLCLGVETATVIANLQMGGTLWETDAPELGDYDSDLSAALTLDATFPLFALQGAFPLRIGPGLGFGYYTLVTDDLEDREARLRVVDLEVFIAGWSGDATGYRVRLAMGWGATFVTDRRTVGADTTRTNYRERVPVTVDLAVGWAFDVGLELLLTGRFAHDTAFGFQARWRF